MAAIRRYDEVSVKNSTGEYRDLNQTLSAMLECAKVPEGAKKRLERRTSCNGGTHAKLFDVEEFFDRSGSCAWIVDNIDAGNEQSGIGADIRSGGVIRACSKARRGGQGEDEIERNLGGHESALGKAKREMGGLPKAGKGGKAHRQGEPRVPRRLHDEAMTQPRLRRGPFQSGETGLLPKIEIAGLATRILTLGSGERLTLVGIDRDDVGDALRVHANTIRGALRAGWPINFTRLWRQTRS